MSKRRLRHLSALITVAGLAVAACGGDDSSSNASNDDTEVSVVPTDPADESTEPEVVLPAEIPTDLVITDITEGDGDGAKDGDMVLVYYVGVLSADGTRFDGNFDGDPFGVTLGQGAVIQGWDQGLLGMKVGGRRQLDIPADLAYGESGSGDVIPPNSAISFVIDLVAIVPAIDPDNEPTITVEGSDELATEVITDDLIDGDGDEATAGSSVVLHLIAYRGDNGEKIASTWTDPSPINLTLVDGGALPGIVEGVQGMKVGGRRQITIPYMDAFGEDGNADLELPAKTDLILVVDLFAAF
ncbi:MAG: peptidylprolyl isomerase [Acidimicrobiia bacterium]|nr:peptidylprolyl isomerase [Acidimicrobiia bacterium]